MNTFLEVSAILGPEWPVKRNWKLGCSGISEQDFPVLWDKPDRFLLEEYRKRNGMPGEAIRTLTLCGDQNSTPSLWFYYHIKGDAVNEGHYYRSREHTIEGWQLLEERGGGFSFHLYIRHSASPRQVMLYTFL